MASDLRDVLNLPGDNGGQRPSKKQKVSAPRPNLKGLAREVQNLGGDNPIAIVPEVTHFKKRRFASRKTESHWELRPFRNSGRDHHDLVLRHWRRVEQKQADGEADGEAEGKEDTEKPSEGLEDSLYAKFNISVSIPEYSDDQYQQVLQSEDWSKAETDCLMTLVRDFDLRWPLIWDRFDWTPQATNGEANADGDESKAVIPVPRPRTMEDLKARYYEIASKMMAAQKPAQYMTQPEYALHEVMSHFNPQQEKARKEFAIHSLERTPEEFREEESLLLEVKRILARNERFNVERKELYNRLDYPHSETDISAFKSSAGLQNLLQNLMSVDKSKKRRSLLGADVPSPVGQAAAQNAVPETTRRDSTTGPGHRDSNAGLTTPSTGNKKGQQPLPERRKLTDKEEAIYGVTHFDRLTSGPAFRTEKINKLFSHKSNQQQLRINNALNELDVPAKLAMPTGATTHQYELLLGAVNSLLEARKVMDKVVAEVKVEEARKAERQKTQTQPETGSEGQEATAANGVDHTSARADASALNGEEQSTLQPSEGVDDETGQEVEAEEGDQDGDEDDDAESNAQQDEDDEGEDQAEDEGDDDDDGQNEDDKPEPAPTGAAHKRSASVLSSVSDKSSKRQRK